MNAVVAFLEQHRARLGLAEYGLAGPLGSLVLTPRFGASRHIVVLVAPRGSAVPRLVVKTPRLRGDVGRLRHEASVLQAMQAVARPESGTVPRVVEFSESAERAFLVETALVGWPLDTREIRKDAGRAINAVDEWLLGLGQPSGDRTADREAHFERLVAGPLRRLAEAVPDGDTDAWLIPRALDLVMPLREAALPRVVEHGDLSDPNVLRLADGRIGVVDWELGTVDGLPLQDFIFFLAYVGFARSGARTTGQYLAAFREAFLGRGAWTRAAIARHARRLDLDERVLTPLFVACWSRYLATLPERLGLTEATTDPETGTHPVLAVAASRSIRANRFFVLWSEAVRYADELRW